ncbi:WEB family protein At3g02930, chloroplastic-like [Mangifera indica]|uniref:WEB family protein At3g02930, chloroplastic-like n=1 Tax=Mangifera indica TaxID=29780 RepID=UPI001CF9DB89|nr:WEB family protein At3g02930, chloroplastic-like [Mangifera indica]
MKSIEELLKETKERLEATEEERDRVVDELQEMKRLAQDANMMLSEKQMSSRKVADLYTEINLLNESLTEELTIKEKYIELLKAELGKEKRELQEKLVEKDASLVELRRSLSKLKSSEAHTITLLSESKKRFQELQKELEKGKESEKKMVDSFAAQTKQLEQTKIVLEESKLEIDSLRKKFKKQLSSRNGGGLNASQDGLEDSKGTSDILKFELLSPRENERVSSLKVKNLLQELSILKNDLKLATEAEETNKKAMDDLALALKEVTSESIQVKEKLAKTQAELADAKAEAEQMKLKLKSMEGEHKAQLDGLKKEAELHKNTIDRLRAEAEESLLAWSGKESCFVGCIRRAEDERDLAREENLKLLESLRISENMTKAAKQENGRLRDVLKQALNEANVAKEAAGIAREENSQLKDALQEKEEALDFVNRENENLKMNEAAALESIKELKRLLCEASAKDDKEQSQKLKKQNSMDKEQNKDGKTLLEVFGINLKELKIPTKQGEEISNKDVDYKNDSSVPNLNLDKVDDPLLGSIFDIFTPGSAVHRRKNSSAFTDEGVFSDNQGDNIDGTHGDDLEGDKNTRKKKALIRKFGDLLMRRGYHKKEPSSSEMKKEPQNQ